VRFSPWISFFALFGVYYSLQYLSLSDATVLIFLSPFCTAIAGALILGENFRLSQAFAGGKWLPDVRYGEIAG
jgi:drug/metabolite transporter (DMT)-like permease